MTPSNSPSQVSSKRVEPHLNFKWVGLIEGRTIEVKIKSAVGQLMGYLRGRSGLCIDSNSIGFGLLKKGRDTFKFEKCRTLTGRIIKDQKSKTRLVAGELGPVSFGGK